MPFFFYRKWTPSYVEILYYFRNIFIDRYLLDTKQDQTPIWLLSTCILSSNLLLCVNFSSDMIKLIHLSKAALFKSTGAWVYTITCPSSGFSKSVLQTAWQSAWYPKVRSDWISHWIFSHIFTQETRRSWYDGMQLWSQNKKVKVEAFWPVPAPLV